MRTGIDKRRSGNWINRLSSTEIFIIQKINNNMMEKFDYRVKNVGFNPLLLVYYVLTFIPKALLAIFFNLKQNKNVFHSLHKRLIHLLK